MQRALFALALLWAAPAYADDVPDLTITPGVVRHDLTVEQICSTKWGKDARAVTTAMKREVFTSYDIKCRPLHGKAKNIPACGKWEIDHLISRELGGADDVKNLWPQLYTGKPWNARMKDRVENRLHKEVCAGTIMLEQAQEEIASDWRVPYRRYFGSPK
jgi:hypothetical protein